MVCTPGSRSALRAACLFGCTVATLACPLPRTAAQLAAPDTHPGPSIVPPTASILLTPAEQAELANWWQAPQAGYQQINRNSVDATANQTAATAVPASLGAATTQSRILQAKALRWTLTGNGDTQAADFQQVKDVLTHYAHVTGGNSLSRPLVAMNYFTAFDLINAGLTAAERTAIQTRLDAEVLSHLGSVSRVSNHFFINHGARGFYAMLSGNQANLEAAVAKLREGYDAVTTNDGFFTDGDRYLNYTLGSMPAFWNAYKNHAGDAVGTAQYQQAAEQHARYALGIRMPNGLSPTFHNSDNMPIFVTGFSRLITDPALKAATVWYAEQLGDFQWNGYTNALNQDGSRTDLVWATDYSAGSRAPDWSPTYFSGGQAKISTFRNDWGPDSNYLATIAGIDGNSFPVSFGHHDTGAITLAANGAQIIVEPGYARFNGIIFGIGADPPMPNTPPNNNPGGNLNTKLAIEHNVLLARHTGTTDWGIGNGATQSLDTNEITITNRLDSGERGNFKGVFDFSTLRSSYTGSGAGSGVQTRRSTGMINESVGDRGYFVMADSFRSSDGVNKDFAVNLIGKSRPENTEILVDTPSYKKVRWAVTDYFGVTSNGAQLSGPPYNRPTNGQVIAHLVSTDPFDAVAHDTSWTIDNWGIFIQTQRMRVGVTNTDMGAILTFFETGAANDASEWTVSPLSGSGYAAARIDSLDGWSDWHISQTSPNDVHSATAGNLLSIDSGAFGSDAQYAYLRRVHGKVDSAMLSRGTTLSAHGDQILSADQPVTTSLLLSELGSGEIHGTLSMDGYSHNTSLTLWGLRGEIHRLIYNGAALNSFDGKTITLPYIAGTTSVPFIVYAVPEPCGSGFAFAVAWLMLSRRRDRRATAAVIAGRQPRG